MARWKDSYTIDMCCEVELFSFKPAIVLCANNDVYKCIGSNHTRKENSHIIRFLSRHNIPYHHVPANKEDKYEEEILNIIRETDFLVLAHYMQVHLCKFF